MSRLKVSLSKTALYGINIDQTQLQQYAQLMGCCVGNFLFEYLGVPIGINLRRISAWHKVIDKFKLKLTGWRGRFLLMAGRIVLLNAILNSLPIHYMSLFKAPVTVIKQLERLRRQFLWGGSSRKKKLHLVAWSIVCKLKELGGLGVVPLHIKNFALLASWWAKFNGNKSSLQKLVI
ncbi:hypothetical protein Tco_0385386 [Tanacetum coccineum]